MRTLYIIIHFLTADKNEELESVVALQALPRPKNNNEAVSESDLQEVSASDRFANNGCLPDPLSDVIVPSDGSLHHLLWCHICILFGFLTLEIGVPAYFVQVRQMSVHDSDLSRLFLVLATGSRVPVLHRERVAVESQCKKRQRVLAADAERAIGVGFRQDRLELLVLSDADVEEAGVAAAGDIQAVGQEEPGASLVRGQDAGNPHFDVRSRFESGWRRLQLVDSRANPGVATAAAIVFQLVVV